MLNETIDQASRVRHHAPDAATHLPRPNRRARFGTWAAALTAAVMISATPARASLVFFNDRASFSAAMTAAGRVHHGTETFEEHNVLPSPVGNKIFLGQVMSTGVPSVNGNLLGFPNGLAAPDFAVSVWPADGAFEARLALYTQNYLDAVSAAVGAAAFERDTHLLFPGTPRQGVGFDLWSATTIATATAQLKVYDAAGTALIGTTTFNTGVSPGVFIGIQSTDEAIGRVEIRMLGGIEVVDNVEMWTIPEPATILLLGTAMAVAVNRRRRNADHLHVRTHK